MLRFRPIAPKPATDGSNSGGWKPQNKNVVTSVRTKRKYVRVKKNNEYYKRRRKRKSSSSSSDLEKSGGENDRNGKLFTLQLLPEPTDLTQDSSPPPRGSSSASVRKDHVEEKMDPSRFFHSSKHVAGGGDLCRVAIPDKTAAMITEKRIIETWVIVETVTDTCMDLVGGLGSTDVEKMKNLGKDTCPGFISDGSNREVQWVNDAYRKMVTVCEEINGQSPSTSPLVQITTRLVIKDKLLPYLLYPVFTCWVRLQYTWQNEKYSQMVPCDVWKMDCGGFAWRLDLKAALSLAL